MLPDADRLPVMLVLASGRGERFLASGGRTHKLQADLCGKTVLQRTLDAVRASGLRWHLEDRGHPGMGDSIAAAVRATREAVGGWMVLPADLPLVRADTLVTIARAPLDGDVLVPYFEGQRGHPVRFAAGCVDALANLKGNTGAAPVVSARKAIKLVVNDAGCVLDIDTVDDLERARATWQIRS
ncbi:molybdopterin-guanine dinucleotide biosynthesis protein MobA [Rhodoferax sp. TH121]|uniref:nucleotidyltransferase family protein n=1 Tax=Rhodoferax sp. TH121 TaxID=2022803 RepID=UPI000B973CD6|nr:nucleotidyltransferase family protein [Rhodoferax sp. TH121]OYQ42996.1 molybdopterin-guanine dinucleotide biosynthesis protein MobA [Rhodoferax sp. TH121]